MGDLSAEPSMEEILSSIKRIIAEEGDVNAARPRRQPRPATQPLRPPPLSGEEAEEVLELSDPMPPAPVEPPRPDLTQPAPPPDEPRSEEAREEPVRQATVSAPQERAPEPIVSQHAAAASRGALDQLTRLMVKPEPGSDGTLEGLVRDMLRPMLRDWLDTNLPALVEAMVQREIKRIVAEG